MGGALLGLILYHYLDRSNVLSQYIPLNAVVVDNEEEIALK